MKHSRLISSCSVILLFSIASCRPFDPDDSTPPKQIEGWAPVYAESGIAIKSSTARTIENGGKIYIKGSRLFQVETGKGIHILNIIDAKNPQKLGFIEIVGCQEISIQGNTLYANHLNDLVSLDISDIKNVNETDRKKDAFHLIDKNHPPANGWFECIDASKGEMIGWEMKTLYSPKCLY